MACRDRLRPLTGPDLLAAIAMVALVAGVTLAFAAPDLSLAGQIPLWDVALAVSVLAVLASVLRFPDWWAWSGGWGTKGRRCAGGRERRASHTVDLRQARSPRARRRPDRPGAHRAPGPLSGGPLTVGRRSRGDWLLAKRRRDSMPQLQRQHGRLRR